MKHFKADDAGDFFRIKGIRQFQVVDFMVLDPVHDKAVAQAGQLFLKYVYDGGYKVGFSPENRSEEDDLSFFGGIGDEKLPFVQIGGGKVRKLFISHFSGFF